ncbi:MAG: rod shape-determining protein [Lachnospiraceae bacterium]|nr:rod shape-determining protein [Lachnospiraceae bacterium]
MAEKSKNNRNAGCAFGIDLGTCNIKIYNASEDKVFAEKNMIAIMNKKNIFAYGDSAFEMYEKTPANIEISYPLSYGVIADIENMKSLVKLYMTDLMKGHIQSADYYIAVPRDVTEVERMAFNDLIRDAGIKARRVYSVDMAVADGLGMDIDVKNAQGVIVVNVGFDTTDISILSLGGIVLSKLVKTGGRKFDEAVKAAIRKEFSLIIGSKTAESVKVSLNELERNEADAVIYGRDIVTGLPVERRIPTKLMDECLKEHYMTIIDNIKLILERTPPELSSDIYRHGIYLTGGASQVAHLSELIGSVTGLRVNTSANPGTSVAMGLARIIKDDQYKSLAYNAEEQ